MRVHGVDPGWQLLWGSSGLWDFVFTEGFVDPCCPVDCQVELEAKREVVSLWHWHPRKAGRLIT